jgi:alpha-tubulin suppressor-like RCC1 family protein
VFERNSPTQIGTDTNWSKISAGASHTIAIKTNGTMWGWGNNQNGGIGDNSLINRSSPVQIGSDTDWTEISCGQFHTLALKSNGTLWNWGSGTTGQLPDGRITTLSSPTQVGSLTNWSKIYSGRFHSVAINTSGEIYTVGLNSSIAVTVNEFSRSSPVQIGTDTNWSDISAYQQNSGAIKSNGTLWVWGNNSEGQLAQNDRFSRSSPTQVGSGTDWSYFPKMGPRRWGLMATKTNGTTWGSGYGFDGAYADDTNITRSSPTQIGSVAWSKITSAFHTIGMDSSGSLYSFGSNNHATLGRDAQLSENRSSPIQVGSATNWVSASMGSGFSVAIKTDGTIWSWGSNGSYQLGDGNLISKSSPVQIGTATEWVSVDCGLSHTIAISE